MECDLSGAGRTIDPRKQCEAAISPSSSVARISALASLSWNYSTTYWLKYFRGLSVGPVDAGDAAPLLDSPLVDCFAKCFGSLGIDKGLVLKVLADAADFDDFVAKFARCLSRPDAKTRFARMCQHQNVEEAYREFRDLLARPRGPKERPKDEMPPDDPVQNWPDLPESDSEQDSVLYPGLAAPEEQAKFHMDEGQSSERLDG